ncbi:hypothetical protein [Bradyrhizobium sp. URHD0069]|uniref:hypothetical protein n=1 Tax=Bradyrhizobium sp. URHD0069 TaxID=1380355 RepID=UPI0012DEE25E|nr:hypothetical protein [Bradyrhizobium sp. URHD0069]
MRRYLSAMPRAEVTSKQAIFPLAQQMLQPGFSAAAIAAKRHVKSKASFEPETLFGSALDVTRRAGNPMTARPVAHTLIPHKVPQATRKQAIDPQAAIRAALRKRNGGVAGDGASAR